MVLCQWILLIAADYASLDCIKSVNFIVHHFYFWTSALFDWTTTITKCQSACSVPSKTSLHLDRLALQSHCMFSESTQDYHCEYWVAIPPTTTIQAVHWLTTLFQGWQSLWLHPTWQPILLCPTCLDLPSLLTIVISDRDLYIPHSDIWWPVCNTMMLEFILVVLTTKINSNKWILCLKLDNQYHYSLPVQTYYVCILLLFQIEICIYLILYHHSLPVQIYHVCLL